MNSTVVCTGGPRTLAACRRLARVALVALALVEPSIALAQAYPSKPIKLVLGFAAGGPTDVMGRALAKRLSTQLGQPVVVENKAGADSVIASQHVARAEADGYTLYLASAAHAINPSLYKDAQFDAVKDFTAISMVGEVPNLVVINASLPPKTLREFIDYAKARKGELNYATTASVTYLSTEMLTRAAGIDIQRIAYKGAGPATTALLAGDVQLMVSGIGPLLPHVKAGKIRALAITSGKRSALAPDIPTVIEAGVQGYTSSVWYALIAPPKMPRDIVNRLAAEMRSALEDAELRNALVANGVEPRASTPEETEEFMRSETQKWAKTVKETGAQAN
jgi:tripartite-type tricarboxylate transporter receptor subunit TctC